MPCSKCSPTPIEGFESKAYRALGSASKQAELVQFLLAQKGQSANRPMESSGRKESRIRDFIGKRPIGIKQAATLGKHFNINPSAFIRFR
jgi:antitoxin component HigA of HigAB toxin-antitoxin module